MFLYELAFIFHNDQLIGSLRHYFDQYPFWLYQSTSSEMPTSGDLKSQKEFFQTSNAPPPPPRKFLFLFGPLTPHYQAIFWEKHQGLQLVKYSSNQTLPYIGVTEKKKLSPFCLQWTTCIRQENEARNHDISVRSQVILEFCNIWSLNLSFCGQLIQTFFYLGVLVTCAGEREIGSVSGRLLDNLRDSWTIQESWHWRNVKWFLCT